MSPMPARRTSPGNPKPASNRRPAMSPEEREQQLIAKAYDLAERQLDEGTASSQVIAHLLKQGTEETKLKRERERNENLLIEARIRNMDSMAQAQELYSEAIAAMREYAGHDPNDHG